MGKKIVYILLGALLIFGLLFLLWSWFFSGSKPGTQNTGTFGTAGDTSQTSGTTVPGGNYTTTLDQAGNSQSAANGSIPLRGSAAGSGTAGVGSGSSTNPSGTGATLANRGTVTVPGATWLGSTNGRGFTSGSGNGFTPTSINGINGGSIGGTVPTIGGSVNTNNANSTINSLLAAGLIGAATCGAQAFINGSGAFSGATLSGGTGAASAAAGVPVGGPVLAIIAANQGAQTGLQAAKQQQGFAGCIINVLAKAALQQITASVVNWINSGFNGSPSFITNYQQFFNNVGDLAAGQFIQGSGLAFLCSPFKLQIKIAIAQSYANRGAQSCSLTGVIKNINSFMNGSFTQGGWPGLLSFTTVPTNNPYGAFAYAQVGLVTAQNNALSNAKNSISPNGFIALQQVTCNGSTSINPTYGTGNQQAVNAGGSATLPNGCTTKITTPGKVIEDSLAKVMDSPIDQLGLANSLDQILNALTTQLVTKTLQGGLLNLSGTSGLQNSYQTPAESAAQAQAQGILTSLLAQMNYAQQYGTILQGSISDVENAQSQLNTLTNCWTTAASSTSVTAAQSTAATANAASAKAALDGLTPQVDRYNNYITSVNTEIAIIQQLQTEALTITSTADVARLTQNYAAAQAAQPFVTQNDVTSAQQNRTTLQSQMGALNVSTQAGLTQCRAFGH